VHIHVTGRERSVERIADQDMWFAILEKRFRHRLDVALDSLRSQLGYRRSARTRK